MSLNRPSDSPYWVCRLQINGKKYKRSTKETDKRKAILVQEQFRQEWTNERQGEALGIILTVSTASEQMYEDEWYSRETGLEMLKRMRWVAEAVGDPPLAQVDEDYVRKLVRLKRAAQCSTATINRYKAHLKTVLHHFARSQRFLPVEISLEAEKEGRIFVLSQGEELKLMELMRSAPLNPPKGQAGRRYALWPSYGDLFTVLLDTGMRVGEALRMTYSECIDLDLEVINLYGEMCKSSKPRTIPMTQLVKDILSTRKALKSDHPFPWTYSTIRQVWDGFVVKYMGITRPDFVIHGLRHTCASRLVQRGQDISVVQALLGHSSVAVTEKYAHQDVSSLRKALRVLESGTSTSTTRGPHEVSIQV